MWRSWRAALVVSALAVASPVEAQRTDARSVTDELKWRVERLGSVGSSRVGDEMVQSHALILAAYEQHGFQPLWTEAAAVQSLLRSIAEVREDGLDPEAYHLSALTSLAQEGVGPSQAAAVAELDLLRTSALVRVMHDLRFGKVEPQGPAGAQDSPWSLDSGSAVDSLTEVIWSGRIREAVASQRPQHFVYDGLMKALADLRRIRLVGGWGPVPDGPALQPDSVDVRVPALRRRLALSGDLGGPIEDRSLRLDSALVTAVRSFQHRHGLNEDGVVGKSTLDALNVPVDRRIDQVRVNLERARWVLRELPDTFVAVNVAGAKVYLVRGDSVAFEARAIVGTPFTQTPVFSAPMLYVDLNPTWTVPSGIVGEVLDLVRRDPGYLEGQGIRVVNSLGRAVDPSGIDFAHFTAESFPYVFRQAPGPANALGQIKLVFPNEHHVYLHDTPTRGLFAREERLFSHGCIRLEDPLGLAELVLGDAERWNRETLRAAIVTGTTRTLALPTPVPVYVLYWTAMVGLDGELHFYRDVYDRDTGLLAGLDARTAAGTAGSLER
jgi:murein L,D-transpeptidase YcbB/YkuD